MLPLFSGDAERVLAFARRAEEQGFDGVFAFDHLFPPGAPADRPSLEAFASLNGPRFYGLPPNEAHITLQARPMEAPEQVEVRGGNKSIVVFRPDTAVGWSF